MNGEPSKGDHDASVEGGAGRLLAAMAMADAHVKGRGIGDVAASAAETPTLDHRANRFCMKMRTLSPGLLSSVPNTE